MTMGFKAPAAGLPKTIAVGDQVDFEIRAMPDGQYQIASMAPVAGASKNAVKPAPMPMNGMKPGMPGAVK
jgi:Cu(I)/Ag(I) efflux system membrane fusion protein